MAKDKFESCFVCKSLGRSCHPGCAFVTLMHESSFTTPSKLEALCGFYSVSFIDALATNTDTLESKLCELYNRCYFYLVNQKANLSIVGTKSMETHVRNLLDACYKEEEVLQALSKNKIPQGSSLPNLEATLLALDAVISMIQFEMELELYK